MSGTAISRSSVVSKVDRELDMMKIQTTTNKSGAQPLAKLQLGAKIRRYLPALFIALTAAILPNSAHAANWYVSPNATGSVHDGKSWATAWTDFSGPTADSRIDWSKIQQADRIQVDTGPVTAGDPQLMLYHTPLVVQKGDCYIESTTEAGHNGGIACIQPDNASVGIDLSKYAVRNVVIMGRKWVKGTGALSPKLVPNLLVQNVATGISIGPSAKVITLSDIRVRNCAIGINATGGITSCRHMMINDNQTNVNTVTNTPIQPFIPDNLNFSYSWIYNSDLQKPTPGIVTKSTVEFNVGFSDGILGPGLSKAFETTGAMDRIDVSSSLLLNASVSQMSSQQKPRVISSNYNILFQTPLNNAGQAHSCFSFVQTPNHYVFGCIVYGGSVDVVGTKLLGAYNKQFRTSGNTVVLSSGQEDPRFYSNPAVLPNNASFDQLCAQSFQAGNNTPGTQYTMYSVDYLLGGMPR